MKKLNIYEQQVADYYFMFGYYSLTGKNNTKIDYEVAFKCLKKASDLGDIEADYYLGKMYLDGLGIEKNLEEAKKHLEKAANYFNTEAMLLLGNIYYDEDYLLAEYWYKMAANSGNTLAMYYLGLMYKNDNFLIKNNSLARYWLEESIKNGYLSAKRKLIKFYAN